MTTAPNKKNSYRENEIPLLGGNVVLYQRKGNKTGIWHCQIKLPGQGRNRFSTGERDVELAKQMALNKYQAFRTRIADGLDTKRWKWDDVVERYLMITMGVKPAKVSHYNTPNIDRFNRAYFSEFFSKFRDIRLITSDDIVDYWHYRIYYWQDDDFIKEKFKHLPGGMCNVSKKPNIRTLRHERNALKNIFMFARNEGIIQKVPQVKIPKNHPNIEEENHRGWFETYEYKMITNELMIRADPAGTLGINRLKKNHRKAHQTPQDYICWLRMRFAVLVMANTGIRPQELKTLRWCDFKKEHMPYSAENPVPVPFVYIDLQAYQSKVRKPREVFFRNPEAAWRWYTQFKELKKKFEPHPQLETDLIFGAYRRRDKPATMSNMFKRLLIELNLREQKDNTKKVRTMYSLRSYYITYQLTHNTSLPIHLLALQCGTSTKMIETTYSKIITRSFREHLIATMRDDQKRKLGIID